MAVDLKHYKKKVSPRNKVFAQKIRDLSNKYSIVGVVDVEGLPAPQFQKIRASVKKNAEVLIVKKNLIALVLKEIEPKHPGISALIEKAKGVVGLIFTNDNPFTLYKNVQKSKSPAPAKGGQIAPKDIVVPAGPTSFSPGPIIGELGAFKIKAGINAGKVEIKADAIVAKEGEKISVALAGILSRLGVEPMEVGLNIRAIYEGGTIYTRSVLAVDEKEILNNVKSAALDAFKLSIGLGYITTDNIKTLIGNAGRDSLGLGVGIAWPAAETIKRLVSKANAQGTGVALSLPEGVRPAGVSAIAQAPVAASHAANEAPKKEVKKAAPEADAASGLAGLF